MGALSVGKYFALGDNARAMIALGESQAAGNVFQKIGELSTQDITAVKQSLDTIVPTYLSDESQGQVPMVGSFLT